METILSNYVPEEAQVHDCKKNFISLQQMP